MASNAKSSYNYWKNRKKKVHQMHMTNRSSAYQKFTPEELDFRINGGPVKCYKLSDIQEGTKDED